jgi:hypothetical protein
VQAALSRRALLAAGVATAAAACDGEGGFAVARRASAATHGYQPIDRAPLEWRARDAEARVLRQVASRFAEAADPSGHGAVGDGRQDDRAALQRALAAGPVDGGGRTFAVDGVLRLSGGNALRNLTIRPLDPSRHGFIVFGERGDFVLDRVTIEKGGTGANCCQAEKAAVRFDGSVVALHRTRVTGDDQGAGFKLIDCRGDAVDLAVHDSVARPRFGPADDLQDGIWLLRCDGFNLIRPSVRRLLTELNGERLPAYSRGVTVSGGRGGLIYDYRGQDVDQHIDLTGDMNPAHWTVFRGLAERGRYHGVKCANTAADIAVLDFVVDGVNRAAFTASAPGPEHRDRATATQRITYENCLARNIGAEAERYLIRDATGFRAETNPSGPWRDYPKEVIWFRCKVEGAERGFHSEAPGARALGCLAERVREPFTNVAEG